MVVIAGTPWSAGRLGTRGHARILFGRTYEDAEIERLAFREKGRVFCIASAGCTPILLSQEHEVVACDINPAQLRYAQRRIQGGDAIEGEAERAMCMARALSRLAGWSRRTLRTFLEFSDVNEQAVFWRERLDTLRFRAGLDAILSRTALRAVYAREFLSVLPPRFGEVMRNRLERGFGRHANAANPYARALLLGELPGTPRKAKPERVQFVLADAAGYLERCPPRSFEAFSLSNILDGAGPAYSHRLRCAVRHAAAPNAVVVLRSFEQPPPELDTNFAEDDRSLLWGRIDVCPASRF